VHASETTVAVLDQSTGEISRMKLRGSPDRVVPRMLSGYDGRLVGVYEAGPTGMGLARAARAIGIDLRVCASRSDPAQAGRSGQDRCA
jgi:hypothetical protein